MFGKKICGILLGTIALIGFSNGAYTGTQYLKFTADEGVSCKMNRIKEFTISSDEISKNDTNFNINLFFKDKKIKKGDLLQVKLFDSSTYNATQLLSFDKSLNPGETSLNIDIKLPEIIKRYAGKKVWISVYLINGKKNLEFCKFPVTYNRENIQALPENELTSALTGSLKIATGDTDFSFYRCKDRFCFDKKLFLTKNRFHWNIKAFAFSGSTLSFKTDSIKNSTYINSLISTGACSVMVNSKGGGYGLKISKFSVKNMKTYKNNFEYSIDFAASPDCSLNSQVLTESVYKNAEDRLYIWKLSFVGSGYSMSGDFLKVARYNEEQNGYDINYYYQNGCKDLKNRIENGSYLFVRALKQKVLPSSFNLFNPENYNQDSSLFFNGNNFTGIILNGNAKCEPRNLFSILKQDNDKMFFRYKTSGSIQMKFGMILGKNSYMSDFVPTQIVDINLRNNNILFKDLSNNYIYLDTVSEQGAVFNVYKDMSNLCSEKDYINQCDKTGKILIGEGTQDLEESKAFVLNRIDGKFDVIMNNQVYPISLTNIRKIRFVDDGNLVFIGKVDTGTNYYLFKYPNYYYPIGDYQVEDIEMVNERLILLTENKVIKVYPKDFLTFEDSQDFMNQYLKANVSATIDEFSGVVLSGFDNRPQSLYFSGCTRDGVLYTGDNSIRCLQNTNEKLASKDDSNNLSANISSRNSGFTFGLLLFLIIAIYLYFMKYGYKGTDILNFSLYGFINSLFGLFAYKVTKSNFYKEDNLTLFETIKLKFHGFIEKLRLLKSLIFKKTILK